MDRGHAHRDERTRRDSLGLTLDQLLAIQAIGGSEAPQWSPNGGEIAFVSTLGGAPDVWSARPDDGLLTRLTIGLGGVGHLASSLPR